jgi:hypothetical protein
VKHWPYDGDPTSTLTDCGETLHPNDEFAEELEEVECLKCATVSLARRNRTGAWEDDTEPG